MTPIGLVMRMQKRAVLLPALVASAVSGTAIGAPTVSNGPTEGLVGTWSGRSLCVTLTRPACTDETVAYRISKDKPGAEDFHVEMSKIVAGETGVMGDLACRFESTRQQLICPLAGGQWQLRWDSNQLVGGLIDDKGGIVRFAFVHRGSP